MTIRISSRFDSGNIEVLSTEDPENIELAIRKDHQSDFFQWFYFRASGVADLPLRMTITNAKDAAFVGGWEDYQAVASYDRETWFRVPTEYEDGQLHINHLPEFNIVYYAYFAPYTYERHQDFVAESQLSPLCVGVDLGETLDGRPLTLLEVSDPTLQKAEIDKKLDIWVIARQHPGESMAEWLMEGFMDRLLDTQDATAKQLLSVANFHIVPNMNPDGSYRGHLRTNAVGTNLNREWQSPSPEKSPEVLMVRDAMEKFGVDALLDVHGDEALPYNFVAGTEGNPDYSKRIATLETDFKSALIAANPDFQDEVGYGKKKPGQANLAMATNWVGHNFDCMAFTLEMPFKDAKNNPDSIMGWSPERCQYLGESLLSALHAVSHQLR